MNFARNARLPRSIPGSFTCRKSTTWDRRLYFPSEGRRAEDFFALKIRRLRPGLNPLTWVPRLNHTLSGCHTQTISKILTNIVSLQLRIMPQYLDSFHQQMHPFIKHTKCQNVQLKHLYVCSYMFRSNWIILRERILSLAKATILRNQSVKIHRYMTCGVVATSISGCDVCTGCRVTCICW